MWQPIETGPKDGCLYLLYTSHGAIFVGKFSKHLRLWVDDKGRLEHANNTVTHWMPLPAPPINAELLEPDDEGDECPLCGVTTTHTHIL